MTIIIDDTTSTALCSTEWCDLYGTVHPFPDGQPDLEDDWWFARTHTVDVGVLNVPHDLDGSDGEVTVDINAAEVIDHQGRTLQTPYLALGSEWVHLTADQARQVCQMLLAGAERLDLIAGVR